MQCTTLVLRDSYPHNCGSCHATMPVSGAGGGAPRCPQKAAAKSLYCLAHAELGEKA